MFRVGFVEVEKSGLSTTLKGEKGTGYFSADRLLLADMVDRSRCADGVALSLHILSRKACCDRSGEEKKAEE